MIDIAGLTYRYPGTEVAALRAAEWRVQEGMHIVMGDSGSGKSTLLRLLNGLVPHFYGGRIGGTAVVAGHDVLRTSTRRMARDVGFVFQDPELQNVHTRVARDAAFALENAAVPVAQLRERVAQALAAAGLAGFEERAVSTLSGGERQRLALAGALALQPRLLVLDEPLSQLDSEGTAALATACEQQALQGTVIVMAEHRLERLSTVLPVCCVSRGQLSAGGTVADHLPPTAPLRPRFSGGDVVLEAQAVSFQHGAQAPLLQRLSFAGRAGSITVISGANGTGKTSLLRILAGILPPTEGRVVPHATVAYLPQEPAAMLHRASLWEEVQVTLQLRGSTDSPRAILEVLGLGNVAQRYPRDLSGGQRQRAAIAAVLAGRPRIVLLDEPTRGMDQPCRNHLCQLLRERASDGACVVVVTHDPRLADDLGAATLELRGRRLEPTSQTILVAP